MKNLSGVEWLSWKRDERTQEFLDLLKADVAEKQQDWLDNRFISDTEHATLMLNAAGLASAQTLQTLINAIEAIQEEKDEGK